jgi:hypothetical protein
MTASDRLVRYYSVGPGYRENTPQRSDYVQSDGIAAMGDKVFPAWWTRKTVEIMDAAGRARYMTPKQERIYIAVMGMIAKGDNNTSMRTIASSLGVCVTTVSNLLRKLMAWGLLGYLSSRGRYGGITLFARSTGDGLDRFARMAAQAVREWWQRKTAGIRARSNVHTQSDRGNGYHLPPYLSSSVDIRNRRIERDDRIEMHLMSLRKGGMKRVPCPAHGGKDANVSFWRRPDGSLGAKCWSHQCTERAIKDAVEAWG